MQLTGAVLSSFFLVAVGLHAAEPTKEAGCMYTVQTADGKFQLVASETLRLLGNDPPDGRFVLPADAPPSVVSFNCIRSSPVPAASDALVLDAGYKLNIAVQPSGGKLLVSFSKAEGQYMAKVLIGRLSRNEKKQLDAAVAAMNARADSSPRAGT
jgi:hypothetical protein